VSILSPCEDRTYTTITATDQNPAVPATDDYSDTPMVFTYVPFTVVPAFCPLTVSCTSFTSTLESTPTSCSETFAANVLTHSFDSTDYTDANFAPDVYTFKITVSSGAAADDDLNPTFDVELTLTDPCLEAVVTVVESTLVDQSYTISDVE